MTGRDLILYIVENGLENEPVFKDGRFIGFMSIDEVAKLNNVGIPTVYTWIALGRMKPIHVKVDTYIPIDQLL